MIFTEELFRSSDVPLKTLGFCANTKCHSHRISKCQNAYGGICQWSTLQPYLDCFQIDFRACLYPVYYWCLSPVSLLRSKINLINTNTLFSITGNAQMERVRPPLVKMKASAFRTTTPKLSAAIVYKDLPVTLVKLT